MSIDKKLVEKLKRIEALFAGATTEGERVAAENAIGRIKKRLNTDFLRYRNHHNDPLKYSHF